jgi:hypothetical protein
MATAEDVECLSSICQALRDVALAPTMTRETEEQVMDLLNLIPEVFSTEVQVGRLAQLLQQCRPIHVVAQYIPLRLAVSPVLRATAIRTLMAVVNVTTSTDYCVDRLAGTIRGALLESNALRMTIHTCCDAHPHAREALEAAEFLFVCVMKIPNIVEDISSDDDGIVRLTDRLFRGPGSLEFSGFLSGLVRIFAERFADLLSSRRCNFIPRALQMLAPIQDREEGMSGRVVVLLCEALKDIFVSFPSAYTANVLDNETGGHLLVDVFNEYVLGNAAKLTMVAGVTLEDCVDAVAELTKAALSIEGTMAVDAANPRPFVYRNIAPLWRRATEKTTAGTTAGHTRLKLLRHAVAEAMTTFTALQLVTPCLECFPQLCALMIPERSNQICVVESTLIVALMCAKSDHVRREIRRMVEGYEPWAANVVGTIHSTLRHFCGEVIRHTLIIDVQQSLLNDGDQAQRIDLFDAERVAKALLQEQTRRSGQATPQPLDVDLIEAFRRGDDSILNENARELCSRLGLEVLVEAVRMAFLSPKESASTAMTTYEPSVSVRQSSPRSLTPSKGVRERIIQMRRAGTPNSSSVTPSAGGTRYQQWIASHSATRQDSSLVEIFGAAKSPQPFRPSSAPSGKGRTAAPLASPAQVSSVTRAAPSATPRSVLDVLNNAPAESEAYLSMAIMMHLPIKFGQHYNRGGRAAVRRVRSPQGVFLQPIKRSTQQSWTAADVKVGELHVIFIPFHHLTTKRVESEISTVEKHLVEMSKLLITTPTSQRSRRWFLHDMTNYVLPKTELVLRDLLEILFKFSAEDVVYQLGVIRLMDEGRQQKDGAFAAAAKRADAAMPREILRFSGMFREVLHSGNIIYAIQQLRKHYYQDGGRLTSNDGEAAEGAQWSTLADIDREIAKLEQERRRESARPIGAADEDVYQEKDEEELETFPPLKTIWTCPQISTSDRGKLRLSIFNSV